MQPEGQRSVGIPHPPHCATPSGFCFGLEFRGGRDCQLLFASLCFFYVSFPGFLKYCRPFWPISLLFFRCLCCLVLLLPGSVCVVFLRCFFREQRITRCCNQANGLLVYLRPDGNCIYGVYSISLPPTKPTRHASSSPAESARAHLTCTTSYSPTLVC